MDNELIYWNFFLDFGPLNLGQLIRFSNRLNDKLRKFPVVCFYSTTLPAKRANAIFLISAWQMLFLGRSPEQAYKGFAKTLMNSPRHRNTPLVTSSVFPETAATCSLPPVSASQGAVTIAPLPNFHDASPCECTYDITVMDCLHGLAAALTHGFFDLDTFDVDEYEHFEQVEVSLACIVLQILIQGHCVAHQALSRFLQNGDLNWLCKDRILAFAGPSYERHVSPEGYCTLAPADYIPYFLERKVSLVVRLNKKAYHEEDFVEAGINHVEAFFLDGSCPPMSILHGVVEAFESVPADEAFAVHCKAGLGRTGTCIGAYLMKHYRMTAVECIAWMRICRPGCVIGPQQEFLEKIQPMFWQEGEASGLIERPLALVAADDDDKEETEKQEAVETTEDTPPITNHDEEVTGRSGQAEGLLAARTRRNGKPSSPSTTPSRKVQPPPAPITPEKSVVAAESNGTTLRC
jgi:cell division cycle 14